MADDLYLVRHAKAGERRIWEADDESRPLSTSGWKQARKVAKRLTPLEPTTLISSPYLRCIQTLEPLADRTGLDIAIDKRLSEGADFLDTLELLEELPGGAVMCSHGDVIPTTIDALVRRGLSVTSTPDWRKASVWVLRRKASGRFTRATVWPPPAL